MVVILLAFKYSAPGINIIMLIRGKPSCGFRLATVGLKYSFYMFYESIIQSYGTQVLVYSTCSGKLLLMYFYSTNHAYSRLVGFLFFI